MEQASSWQLFNTTWNLHRISPLHHGKDCDSLLEDPAALKLYATRLRDHLTGDVLAGLHAASTVDSDSLSKTGALKECTWQSITRPTPRDSTASRNTTTAASFPGILVTLEYENITYKAALLAEIEPGSRSESQGRGSTFLPLLLTKLPTALRQTFISFLSSNFDTYCSSLHLSSPFLCKGLETFIDALRNAPGSYDDTIEEVVKELQLTLAFSAVIAPSLRNVNIGISRNSVAGFLDDSDSNKSGSRTLEQKLKSPLIANLTLYLEMNLAMSLDLDGSSQNSVSQQHVRLSKLACAAFVLGSEGRVKLVVDVHQSEHDETVIARNESSLRASESLLRILIRKAVIKDQAT